jgi:hypothetical protein
LGDLGFFAAIAPLFTHQPLIFTGNPEARAAAYFPTQANTKHSFIGRNNVRRK